jgi:hypothetical protein
MLAGWYIDILIGYLIRAVIRLVKLRRSESWSLEDAVVSSSTRPLAPYGGPVAEIGYTYNHAGGYYAGVHGKPFILRSSAEEYAAKFAVGAHITIRIDPKRPEVSVFREDDQTRMRVRLQQVAIDQPRP